MSPPRSMTPDAAPVEIHSLALRQRTLANDRDWRVPTDIVLALPTASALKAVVYARQANRDWPLPISTIYLREGRYFAEVPFFGVGRPAVFYALDIWPLSVEPKGAR